MHPVARAARIFALVLVTTGAASLLAQDLTTNAAPAPKRRSARSSGPPAIAAPVAAADAYEVAQGTTLTVPAPGVLANDTVAGGTITGYGAATGLEQTTPGSPVATSQSGSVTIAASGAVTFTPRAGFSGTDTFRYTIANAGGSSSATVTITVRESTTNRFVVTAPGFFYLFAGIQGQNPQITLVRGQTYTFVINTTSNHPFEIVDAPAGSVSDNNIFEGTIVFTVPMTARDYRYRCSLHEFGNVIRTVAPSPPPNVDANRQAALSFHRLAFVEDRARDAAELHASASFVLHAARDERIGGSELERFTRSHRRPPSEVVSVLAEGDRVGIHTVERWPGGFERMAVDLFRFDEDGRIVEQWYVSDSE